MSVCLFILHIRQMISISFAIKDGLGRGATDFRGRERQLGALPPFFLSPSRFAVSRLFTLNFALEKAEEQTRKENKGKPSPE